jgi:hypothetical protein
MESLKWQAWRYFLLATSFLPFIVVFETSSLLPHETDVSLFLDLDSRCLQLNCLSYVIYWREFQNDSSVKRIRYLKIMLWLPHTALQHVALRFPFLVILSFSFIGQ